MIKKRLLNQEGIVDYVDHHKGGDLLNHLQLHTNIDLSADTSTLLIVDKQLQVSYCAWAVTDSFGDYLVRIQTPLNKKFRSILR